MAPLPPAIDAHHHVWRYRAEEYPWIDAALAEIRRDFLPEDLAPERRAAGIEGVITVQARQSVAETCWLLELAAGHPFIRGVVGWAPLAEPDVAALLEGWRANEPKLRGVRHVLQGEPDPGYLLRADFNRGLAALAPLELAYDLLIHERQLEAAIALVDRHPAQTFVLDHLAKPRIGEGIREPWARHLRELARRPRVFCKLSGLVTEAGPGPWTEEALRPYFLTALEAFGPGRLLFGSDWPVCLPRCGYRRWAELVRGWTSGLSAAEQAAILGGNAARAYRL